MNLFYTLFFFAIPTLFFAQHSVQNELESLVNNSFFKHAQIGISVRSVNDGELLANISKDKMFIPASTLKLLTTLIAKKKLGANFKFSTTLSYDGELLSNGTLKGNIYITGNGDPTLGSGRIPGNKNLNELLHQMVNDIKSAGIQHIDGDIIAEISEDKLPPLADSWQWQDLGNYYASGAWSINVNENLYNIYYNRNFPIGELAQIAYIEPSIPKLSIESLVTLDSANTDDNAYIFGVPFQNEKIVKGTIPQGKGLFKIKGAIPDPPLFLVYKLQNALFQSDIKSVTFRTERKNPSSTKILISTYLSPNINEIIRYTNDFSINIYAEAIYRALDSTHTIESAALIKKFLLDSGLDITALQLEDGSGLSTRNLMSPDLMTLFLSRQLPNNSENDIKDLISAVGERGTVKNLLLKSPAKGKMWLKSGSMEKILCYAGYCRTSRGKLVAFSIFLNGSTAKKEKHNKEELEKILDAIYRFS